MNLESHARRLSNDWEYDAKRTGQVGYHIGNVWKVLTDHGDKGTQPNTRELRDIAEHLDRAEEMLRQHQARLAILTRELLEFAEAVNDHLADAEPAALAPEWSVQINGLDDEAIDRIARFYRDSGHDIR